MHNLPLAHSKTARFGRQAGIGLLEVLVSVLILSMGFLGIAALQAKSLSTNNSAMTRSMAIIASYSILDAMRADRANALTGAYNQTVTANACPAAGTLAQNQLKFWCLYQLAPTLGALASTTGTILCAGLNNSCTVTIQFDDSRSGVGGSSTQQVITSTIL